MSQISVQPVAYSLDGVSSKANWYSMPPATRRVPAC